MSLNVKKMNIFSLSIIFKNKNQWINLKIEFLQNKSKTQAETKAEAVFELYFHLFGSLWVFL